MANKTRTRFFLSSSDRILCVTIYEYGRVKDKNLVRAAAAAAAADAVTDERKALRAHVRVVTIYIINYVRTIGEY